MPAYPRPKADKRFPSIKDHVIEEEVGHGAMGTVYRAIQTKLNRPVAIKMMSKLFVSPHDSSYQRFLRESETLAKLSHPNIVQVYDRSDVEGRPYFVMEYLSDGTLAEKIAGKPQDPYWAAKIVEQAARAMHEAHKLGILHRDIKPTNLMMYGPDSVKISDFGLAHSASSDLTRDGLVFGTTSYMSFEQANGYPLTAQADVYSLTAVLFELITGRPPYQGRNDRDVINQIKSSPPLKVRQLIPTAPIDLDKVCQVGLDQDLSRRYKSALDLADDLARFQQGVPVKARPIGPVARFCRLAKRNILASSLITALAIILITLVVSLWINREYVRAQELNEQKLNELANRQEAERFLRGLYELKEIRQGMEPGWSNANLTAIQDLANSKAEKSVESKRALRSEAIAALTSADLELIAEIDNEVPVYCLVYSPDGKTIITAPHFVTIGGSIRMFDAETFELKKKLPVPANFAARKFTKKPDGIRSIAISPNGRWLAVGYRSGEIARYDLHQEDPKPTRWTAFPGPKDEFTPTEINRLMFTEDSTILLGGRGGNNGLSSAWDAKDDFKQLWTVPNLTLPYTASSVKETVPSCLSHVIVGMSLSALSGKMNDNIGQISDEFSVDHECNMLLYNNVSLEMPMIMRIIHNDVNISRLLDRGGYHSTEWNGGRSVATHSVFSPNSQYVTASFEQSKWLHTWDTLSREMVSGHRFPDNSTIASYFSPNRSHIAVCVGQEVQLFRYSREFTRPILLVRRDIFMISRSVLTVSGYRPCHMLVIIYCISVTAKYRTYSTLTTLTPTQ